MKVMEHLNSEMSSGVRSESHLHIVPFFNPGYVKLSFDKEKLPEIEAEVRRRIAESFPDLTVSIEGHSTSSGK